MNQKKAKALRRSCRQELILKTVRDVPVYGIIQDKITKRMRWAKTGMKPMPFHVNNYKLAKRLYRGSVPDAVTSLRRHVRTMVSLGIYKVA